VRREGKGREGKERGKAREWRGHPYFYLD